MRHERGPADRPVYVTKTTHDLLRQLAESQKISLGGVVERLLWVAGYGRPLPEPESVPDVQP